MNRINLLLFVNIIFITNLFAKNDSTKKSCLVITNNRPDVEVFINNKSYGKFLSEKFYLPPGRYEIFGRINNYYDDYERVKLTASNPEVVTLRVKKYQFHISPRAGFVYIGKNFFQSSMSINLGFKSFRHHFGISFKQTQLQDFIRGGIYYSYILWQNKYMIFEPGISSGYSFCGFEVEEPTPEESVWPEPLIKRIYFQSFDIGPKIMYQIGLDHVKLCTSYEFIFSKMLISIFEAGIAVNF